MSEIHFIKYQAAGNDFILVDARCDNNLLPILIKNARGFCDRHFGIGADGILVITRHIDDNSPQSDADAAMHIINADGSIAAMCGNGIRCAASYLYHQTPSWMEKPLYIDTLGGLQKVYCQNSNKSDDDNLLISVSMAKAQILGFVDIVHQHAAFHGTKVDVGNPHAVFEVKDNPLNALNQSGAFLSNHSVFPDRCNIEFIQEISINEINLAVYERGAGPTLACGTGCVASALAYCAARNTFGNIIIHAPGGMLNVQISPDESPVLTGPAHKVFAGMISIE